MSAATGSVLLAGAVARLRKAGIPDPARDARRLLAHALEIAPGRLTLVLPEPVPAPAAARFEAALDRRAAHEPVSHIVGLRAFWGRDFKVTRDVLDPRPETEILIEAALSAPFSNMLDLGTGSGCILLTLLAERPGAAGLGTDISAAALSVARGNAGRLGVSVARFLQSDWYQAVEGRFDLIVSNPPYIAEAEMPGLAPDLAHEPRGALTDGGDGLSAYRAIAAGARARLAPGGRLLVEIGPTQAAAVSRIFAAAGLEIVAVRPDLDGRHRVVETRVAASGT
ncbi:protein-(glutamine-N5) methyltransferase, release factor-specific [Rhodovulum sulfidophilum]|uniref:peptide chain release factor N(5)-glutamine methyltransferase n=1 Tax=Rhodovulum sulfidophilum TaxID=35806 RepID=UPI001913FC60|nr:peptide chain release factor N(5)-glutamine methyltransferase [Rhodovulum sulfidophilum]MBK5924237.1 protein-(glutamine-N5) methyltransferase, release factor-specific [Rhodovulum sulfidophilum]